MLIYYFIFKFHFIANFLIKKKMGIFFINNIEIINVHVHVQEKTTLGNVFLIIFNKEVNLRFLKYWCLAEWLLFFSHFKFRSSTIFSFLHFFLSYTEVPSSNPW